MNNILGEKYGWDEELDDHITKRTSIVKNKLWSYRLLKQIMPFKTTWTTMTKIEDTLQPLDKNIDSFSSAKNSSFFVTFRFRFRI